MFSAPVQTPAETPGPSEPPPPQRDSSSPAGSRTALPAYPPSGPQETTQETSSHIADQYIADQHVQVVDQHVADRVERQPGLPDTDSSSASVAPPQEPDSADHFVRRSVHGDPIMRRFGQGVRKAVGASGAQNMRQQVELLDRIRTPIASCRQIAVTSIRGGAGKTTVSALVGAVIAEYRTDRVLTVDADPGLGSLPLRLGTRAERSLRDLAGSRLNSFEEARPYLGRAAENLWVLPANTAGRVSAELELETFRAAMGNLTRYFSATIIDCGAGIGELQRGILANAHGQVIVAQGTADGALSTRSTLEWMAGNVYRALLDRTVVVLVTHSPHVDGDLEQAHHMLSAGGMPVVQVPYDRQLAIGAAIDMTRVSEGSRMAATRIAAEALARSTTV